MRILLAIILCLWAGVGDSRPTALRTSIVSPGEVSAYRDAALQLGPLAYWPMDEQSTVIPGAKAVDIATSANTYQGTYVNTPSLGKGALVPSQAIDGVATACFFARAPDEHMTSAPIVLTSAFSIVFWMNCSHLADLQVIASQKENDGAVNGWQVWITATDGFVVLQTNDNAGGTTTHTGTVGVADGVTHCVVVTFASGTARIYVDGDEDNNGAGLVTPSAASQGANTYVAANVDGNSYLGTLDEVAIYATTLSADSVLDLYYKGTE